MEMEERKKELASDGKESIERLKEQIAQCERDLQRQVRTVSPVCL